MKRVFSLVCGLLFGGFWPFGNAWAQISDDKLLPSVEVQAQKKSLSKGFKTSEIDSTSLQHYAGRSLAELLANQSSIFIKSYGVGGAALPSFRGTAAHHTQVLWNDMPINSPLLGLTDLSLVAVTFADEIAINYGGGSTLTNNSGNLGGAILLKNQPDWHNKLSMKVLQNIGSYGLFDTQGKIQGKVGKWNLGSRFFRKSATNNFSFRNTEKFGQPRERFSNAAQSQQAIMQDAYYQLNNAQILSAHVWYQAAERALGSPMLADGDEQQQHDESLRTLVQWKLSKDEHHAEIKTAYFRENYRYRRHILQSPIELHDENHSDIVQTNGFWEWFGLKNLRLKTGANIQYERGVYLSQISDVTQYRTGIYVDFSWQLFSFWQVSGTARQERTDQQFSPLLPSLSNDIMLLKRDKYALHWRSNVAKNYRVPTLNERFRIQGKSDLLPELHKTAETSLAWKRESNSQIINAEVTYFESVTNDWIVWLRQGRGGFSQPLNLKKVKVSGLEVSGNLQTKIGADLLAKLKGNYTYTHSRNLQAFGHLDESVGKQMIYMPKYSAQVIGTLHYKRFTLSAESVYHSKRYTSTDNALFLKSYHLYNLLLGYTWSCPRHELSVNMRINNITNTDYQSIAFYPMPMSNGSIAISYQWNKR